MHPSAPSPRPAPSPPRFRRGLVVGKFCPLHRGHEWLLAHAQAACHELLIISYTKPGFPGYPRERRDGWLRALFPSATVLVLDDSELAMLCQRRGLSPRAVPEDDAPEQEHRCFVGWLCTHLLGLNVDAVFTSEDYGDGFAAVLSDWFRTHGHRVLPAHGTPVSGQPIPHISVDPDRVHVPISGTRLRAEPGAHAQFLSPLVRDDLGHPPPTEQQADAVPRLCILGAESSGKTTLAAALACQLNTVWVAEYGRDRWIHTQGNLTLSDMALIGRTQVQQERLLAAQARGWLVCDTSPLTTLFYSLALFGEAAAELEALADRSYHQVLLCAPDFGLVQDGTRQDEAFRQRQHQWYLEQLQARGIPAFTLSGPPQARLDSAWRHLIQHGWLQQGSHPQG